MNVFKALSSETRQNIVRILMMEETHITDLARQLNLSVPVIAKHVGILDDAGIVQRRVIGRTHLLKLNKDKLRSCIDILHEPVTIDVKKGSNILDVLKQVSGIGVEKVNDNEYLTAIDGEDGYFIYEVNGESPKVTMNRYTLDDNVDIELKKMVLHTEKKIRVRIKD